MPPDGSPAPLQPDDHILAFRSAMEGCQLVFKGPIEGDGRIHRVHIEGDKPGSRNGWYVLHLDGKPAGAFGCKKRLGDEQIKWTTQGTKPLTREEKRALAEKAAADKIARADKEAAMHAAAARQAVVNWEAGKPDLSHPYLDRKGVPNYGLRVGDYAKDWPDPETGEIKTIRVPNSLMIPLYVSKAEIVSMQAIFPAERHGRDKDFLPGGRKRGCYFMIGKPIVIDGVEWVIICEGYATGASVHRATGIGVMVAFDAGNMLPVAEKLRAVRPDAGILFAADNDRWTVKPVENPGVTRAREAAAVVRGRVAIPDFPTLDGKPTDFNDLDKLGGQDAVRAQIMGVISTRPVSPPPDTAPSPDEEGDGPPPDDAPPHDGEDIGYGEAYPDDEPAHEQPPAQENLRSRAIDAPLDGEVISGVLMEPRAYFVVLGHDRDSIYVYQCEMKMIVARPITYLPDGALTSLAPLNWWEREWPSSGKEGWSRKAAVNWLQRLAFSRGFFDPKKVRGRGAWIDEGRVVYHFGKVLTVDGVVTDLQKIKSEYVYEQGTPLERPADVALSDEDGKRLFALVRKFRWTRKGEDEKPSASAIMLIGWAALAPFSGALKWRPHVWITGGPGSGKSTILTLLAWLLNNILVHAQGNSTEAGVRQELHGDALPVVFDEAESNDERENARMKAFLAMTRQSSSETGARTFKGTTGGKSMDFMVRSMFCLGSIQVSIKQQADRERFVRLELRSKKQDGKEEMDGGQKWSDVKALMAELRADKTMPARLMRRSLDLLPTTQINIETFTQAAAGRFGNQRVGDQYGPLLAGAWSLMSSKVVSFSEAEQIIDRYSWNEYMEDNEEEESDRALGALLNAQVRMQSGLMLSVAELVSLAAGMRVETAETITQKEAVGVLRRNGMRVETIGGTRELWLSNSFLGDPQLIAGTSFSSDLRGQLKRIQGAKPGSHPQWFSTKERYLSIPLERVIDENGREPRADAVWDDDPPV